MDPTLAIAAVSNPNGTAFASFDPNQFYRITNLALGPEASLDVQNRSPPDGSLIMQASGPFSGQVWQILEASTAPGHYYLSGQFLGAKRKLDALVNAQGDYAPHLRDYNVHYAQTWTLTSHKDELGGNRTTWTMAPDFVQTGGAGNVKGVFSVYEDTRAPYLAPYASSDKFQRWSLTREGLSIDDPTFSATHLPALATEAPIIAFASSPAASNPSSPSEQPSQAPHRHTDDDKALEAPLIAAAVVPTTVVAIAVVAFLLFICMRRRKLRQMDRNSPYPIPTSRPGSFRGGAPEASSSAVFSEIVDTFTEKPMEQWVRENEARRWRAGPEATSVSLMSSNLSATWRSIRGIIPGSTTSVVMTNPLRPPPPSRTLTDDSGKAEPNIISQERAATRTAQAAMVSFIVERGLPSPGHTISHRDVRESTQGKRRDRPGKPTRNAASGSTFNAASWT